MKTIQRKKTSLARTTRTSRKLKAPRRRATSPAPRRVRSEAELQALRQRAAAVWEWPLDYIDSAEFAAPDADQRILAAAPPAEAKPRKVKVPAGLPSYLASLYEMPLLTKEQEQYLFRKYNYLKYRASQLREKLNPVRPSARRLDELERLYREATETKNEIIRANLRLVVSIAKKYTSDVDGLFDLISDGNMSLLKAVEKFDYSLGFKFSTYATWAIKKNYARDYVTRIRHVDRFRTSQDEVLQFTADQRSDAYRQELEQNQRESQVAQILKCLSPREKEIIAQRYGLNEFPRSHTLKEVGESHGVSKERVRQLVTRALDKLREAVENQPISIPA